MTKNEKELRAQILARSVNQSDFDIAKKEWILKRVYYGTGSCLCGHTPIAKLCQLHNKLNHQDVIVGSTCVQKFIGIKTESLFSDYIYIKKDIQAFVGKLLIQYLFEAGIINEWEKEFLLSTFGKKFERLSEKQQAKRIQINNKILEHMEIKEPEISPTISQSEVDRFHPYGDDLFYKD